jgi:non-heme chloroperoxidase
MTPLSATPSNMPPDDKDLAEQAVPGHGIPSQDPDPVAQTLLTPLDSEREARSALVGGGAIAGVATGASIGGMVAGPVGIVVGATLGAVAGALGGQAAGAAVNPEESHSSEIMATTVTPRK